MRAIVLLGSCILIIVVSIVAIAFTNKKTVPGKHIEVVLRELGHQLLLSAKDSSSRVLPVKRLNGQTFQIAFQNELGFVSDTLINLVERTFEKNGLANSYVVGLKSCEQKEAVFAFEINNQTGDLTPCRGRTLDVGCYIIEIEFLNTSGFSFFWLLLLVFPLLFIGYYVKDGFWKKEQDEPILDDNNYIQLGDFRFYAEDNVLKTGDNNIILSEKETKALKIFAQNINQVVEREYLMKQIWEEQGVVVISRNVDVLVSKLRKKLSDDNSIQFTNVPGRGYKFVVGKDNSM